MVIRLSSKPQKIFSSKNSEKPIENTTSKPVEVIDLRKKKTKKKTSTIGEQIKRGQNLPIIGGLFSTPALTGTAIGGTILMGGGIPAVIGAGLTAPFAVGLLKSSPTIDRVITDRILDPEGSGEKVGGGIESTFSLWNKFVNFVKEKPLTTGLLTGVGTAGLIGGGLALAKYLKPKTPTLPTGVGSTPISAPAVQAVADAPARISVPSPVEDKIIQPEASAIQKLPKISIKNQINTKISVKPQILSNSKIYKRQSTTIIR